MVQRLAKLWKSTLAAEVPLDKQSEGGVIFVLRDFQKLLEEMPEPYPFSFEPSAEATPRKRPRSLDEAEPLTSEKRPRASKKLCTSVGSDTATWLHRRDHELKAVQDVAVQLLCQERGGRKEARALVVSGAHPLKALGQTFGAAFVLEGVIFDPHPNKGWVINMSALPQLHTQGPGWCRAHARLFKLAQAPSKARPGWPRRSRFCLCPPV